MTNPVQEWSGYAFGSSATATAGTLPTAGHGVVIVIGLRSNISVTSITDNQTGSPNTYTRAVTSAGPDSDVDIWYCNSLTINQSSFVLTVTPSASNGIQIFAAEIVGLNGVDQTNSINSSGSSSVTTLAVTNSSANTNANDIVIAGFTTGDLSGGTIGLIGPASTGYTNIGNFDYTNNQSSNGSYKLVSAIETSSATFSWTTATPYVTAAIASFKLLGNPNTALDTIKTGTTPGDATGDPARVGGTKINDALISIYSALGSRATTPGCFGVSSSAGMTTTLIDATQNWATNQFAGQYVTITTGTLPSSGTATSNIAYSSLIASNTPTTLTFSALPFATTSGCGYDISPVVTTAQTDGQATSVGGTNPHTLIDASKAWTVNQFTGYYVTFIGGSYAGKSFQVLSNTATTLTLVENPGTAAIAAGTPYCLGSVISSRMCDIYLAAGSTDVHIQAAINRLSALGGGSLHLLSGNFPLSNPVTLASGVSIYGVPTTFTFTGGLLSNEWVPSNGTIITSAGATQAFIANTTALGSGWSGSVTGITGVNYQDLCFSGFSQGGLVIGGINNPGLVMSRLKNLAFYQCGSVGTNYSNGYFALNLINQCNNNISQIYTCAGPMGIQIASSVPSTVGTFGNSLVSDISVDITNLGNNANGVALSNFARGLVIGIDPNNPSSSNAEIRGDRIAVYAFSGRTPYSDSAVFGTQAVTFASAPVTGATAVTLSANFTGSTGVYTLQFSTGTTRAVKLTNGSTAVSNPNTGSTTTAFAALGSATYTTSATALSCTISHAEYLQVGMPVVFTSNFSVFSAGATKMVQALYANSGTSGAGSVVFAVDRSSYPQSLTGGTLTYNVYGMPLLDLGGPSLGTTQAALASSVLRGLDLEGPGPAVYVESASGLTIEILELTGPAVANDRRFVGRGGLAVNVCDCAVYCKNGAFNYDSNGLLQFFGNGQLLGSGTQGLFVDQTNNVNGLNIGPYIYGPIDSYPQFYPRGPNSFLYPNMPIGQRSQSVSATQALIIYYAGFYSCEQTSAITLTLPALTAGSYSSAVGAKQNASAGVPFEFVNAGTGNVTIGAANSSGSLFNNATHTNNTIVLTPGQSCLLRAAETAAGVTYWAVLSNFGTLS